MINLLDLYLTHKEDTKIEKELYTTHCVKNGLRNEDGTGVLVGLTKISDVVGYQRDEKGNKVEAEGSLLYRGIDLNELINDSKQLSPYIYERVCFLIIFGYLPNDEEFKEFKAYLANNYDLPFGFLQSEILRFPAKSLMNKLQKDILTLYNYDANPDSVELSHNLKEGLAIVARMPSLICYNYECKQHFFNDGSMHIHHHDKDKSIAENILLLSRDDRGYTAKEAEVLDICLALHADHGGGNNSTFTSTVISSTGTDLYSALSGSIGSLKGPKHGGANLAVSEMMDDVINAIGFSKDKEEIRKIVRLILDKQFHKGDGIIYGMGHAVYTLSDPRSKILKKKAQELAKEEGMSDKYDFYALFEEVASEEFYARKGIHISSNVDFYSGLVYEMLGIPKEMYTLLFASARSVGWIAHIIEHQLYSGRIVRPATKYVGEKHSLKEEQK